MSPRAPSPRRDRDADAPPGTSPTGAAPTATGRPPRRRLGPPGPRAWRRTGRTPTAGALTGAARRRASPPFSFRKLLSSARPRHVGGACCCRARRRRRRRRHRSAAGSSGSLCLCPATPPEGCRGRWSRVRVLDGETEARGRFGREERPTVNQEERNAGTTIAG